MPSFTPAFPLATGVQSYEWGKIGSASKAAQLGQSTPSFKIDESKPYAEVFPPKTSVLPLYPTTLTYIRLFFEALDGNPPLVPVLQPTHQRPPLHRHQVRPESLLGSECARQVWGRPPFLV